MPRVAFTGHLRRYLDLATMEVEGGTVRGVLEAVFAKKPLLRGYIVDEQSELRKHVVVFVNDRRVRLDESVDSGDEIYVLQALSGG
jgi:sulfur-carrier protein